MNSRLVRVLCVGLFLAAAVSCESPKEETKAPASAGVVRGRCALVSLTFSVEAVDAAKRTITLKDSEKNVETYHVGEEVKRFSEIKAGDSLVVQYFVGVFAELREANAEEKAAPILVVQETSRAPTTVPPTGAITRSVRVVTTISALDAKEQSMTIMGPRKNTLTTKIEDGEIFKTLKVGQPLVATFGEQLLLAIEPKK